MNPAHSKFYTKLLEFSPMSRVGYGNRGAKPQVEKKGRRAVGQDVEGPFYSITVIVMNDNRCSAWVLIRGIGSNKMRLYHGIISNCKMYN